MTENEIINLCENYVYTVWKCEYLFSSIEGIIPYSITVDRMEIHEKLANAMGFPDTTFTLEVCYNLDEYIGYEYSRNVEEMDFKEYGKRLYKALLKLKKNQNNCSIKASIKENK